MEKRVAGIQNLTRGQKLAERVRLCRGFWSRLVGLIGTSKLSDGEACWLEPCNSIHTMGMNYAIDAYFLNRNQQVVQVLKNLKPNRFSPIVSRAVSVLEFASNHSRDCEIGDQLQLVFVP